MNTTRTDWLRLSGMFCVLAVTAWMVAASCALAGPHEEADKAYEKGDFKTAMLKWLEAAEAGDMGAMNKLGFGYATHLGDYATAVKLWRKASEAGHAEAQNNLGIAYDLGRGVPRSDKLALHWFLRSAKQGYTKALYNLGRKYDNGEGVAANEVTAYMFFILAASGGEEAFEVSRDKLGEHLTSTQKQTAQKLAREWLQSTKKN